MAEEEPLQARMSLSEHLGELRSRLLRVVIAVLVLGAAGLVFARPIFGFLMKPVLDALPPSERSLIYTSGIEELNVLMKVGLYAGIFLATPVLLTQIWGFVAPGLYPRERKYAFPFVLLGTVAFLIGAAFCYLVVLPTMFKFLLSSGDTAPIKARVERARAVEGEALRFARSGDFDRAANLADGEVQRLTAMGDGRVSAPDRFADGTVELQARLDAEGRLVDAPATASGWARRRRCGSRSRSGWRRWTPSSPARRGRPPRRWSSPPRSSPAPRAARARPWPGCGRCRRRSPPVRARWQRRPGPGRCSR